MTGDRLLDHISVCTITSWCLVMAMEWKSRSSSISGAQCTEHGKAMVKIPAHELVSVVIDDFVPSNPVLDYAMQVNEHLNELWDIHTQIKGHRFSPRPAPVWLALDQHTMRLMLETKALREMDGLLVSYYTDLMLAARVQQWWNELIDFGYVRT